MSVKDKLSYTVGRRDQEPNKVLAIEIAQTEDYPRLNELISVLEAKPHIEIQKDCILTLAWIAEIRPEMMVSRLEYFIEKLNDPVNRIIWGSMIALSFMAKHGQEKLFDSLPKILDAMDKGTVVTRDHGFRILIALYENKKYREDIFIFILEQLSKAPSNQLGQYTEKLLIVMDKAHKEKVIAVLEDRRNDLDNESHKKRLNKNLKKLHKL